MIKQLSVFTRSDARARESAPKASCGQASGDRCGKDFAESVNSMASNLTAQVRNIADATTRRPPTATFKKITADVRGEILQLKASIITMVDQLRSFASEDARWVRGRHRRNFGARLSPASPEPERLDRFGQRHVRQSDRPAEISRR